VCAAKASSECNQIQDGIASFFWLSPQVFAALGEAVNASSRNTDMGVSIVRVIPDVAIREIAPARKTLKPPAFG
jgi:hypothetical protein